MGLKDRIEQVLDGEGFERFGDGLYCYSVEETDDGVGVRFGPPPGAGFDCGNRGLTFQDSRAATKAVRVLSRAGLQVELEQDSRGPFVRVGEQ